MKRKLNYSDEQWESQERRQNPRVTIYALIIAFILWAVGIMLVASVIDEKPADKSCLLQEKSTDQVAHLDPINHQGGNVNGP